LLLSAAAAHAAPPFQSLPFLPNVFNKSSSFVNDSEANAALSRFRKVAGGSESLSKRENILRSLNTVKGRVLGKLRKAPAVKQELLTDLADRLKGAVFDRPSVADINKPIAQYLYGGDVMLSDDEVARMETGADLHDLGGSLRFKRGAPLVIVNRWPTTQPIGFTFNSDINEATRKVIRTATQKIAANTCLSFRENSNVGTQLQFHQGGGCWSYIGRQTGAKQLISIDKGCEIVAIASHEISHALGLDHTQDRKDRDAYVTVNTAAVNFDLLNNFAKRTDAQNNNFGVPYEYGSDMHYGAYDFSNNGQPVLVPSQGEYLNTMGQRKSLTFSDYKLINSLYNCNGKCGNQLTCQNGGYRSPKNCYSCVCSDFFTGTTCQTPRITTNLATGGSSQTVFHTDYNQPLYSSGNDYNWDMFSKDAVRIIRAPAGRKIRVTFNRMYPAFGQLPCYVGCPFNGVEIVDNAQGDLTTLGKVFCCAKDEGASFVSQTNVIGYKAFASPGMPFDATVTYTVV
ncbi:hypothetical protein PENTCL1PPCAC_21538, partial [Pristionchus entomophagus]